MAWILGASAMSGVLSVIAPRDSGLSWQMDVVTLESAATSSPPPLIAAKLKGRVLICMSGCSAPGVTRANRLVCEVPLVRAPLRRKTYRAPSA